MTGSPSFLSEFQRRPVDLEGAQGLQPEALVLGQGARALEVVVTRSEGRPSGTLMREVWGRRQRGRGVPLVLVALYGERAAVCGPSGEDPPVYADVDPSVVERVCATALAQPSRHAALRFLHGVLPHLDSALPGIRNEGFVTLHELIHGVGQRREFAEATQRAQAAAGKHGLDLLSALGFECERIDDFTYLLIANDRRRATAVLLQPDELPDVASSRFAQLSPVSYALSVAEGHNVPYVILVTGTGLRLHPVRDGVGVAQRGRVETFVEINLDLVPPDRAGYLWMLFSAEALAEGGTLEGILERARDHALGVGTRLRERIYRDVIPDLAMAIWKARGIERPSAQDLADTYQMALTLLFRLLFIAYAEDKELLPLRTHGAYETRSLKRKAQELFRMHRERTEVGSGTSYWEETRSLCRAIDGGEPAWNVPQYNGQLFSAEPNVSPVGAQLEGIALPNDFFVPVLYALLVDQAPTEGIIGPVDFSALGVREFGTIYEGLLENELAIAETDLTTKRVKDRDIYWPVEEKTRKGVEVVVRQGEAYLHDASGARKATGSYYTKPFAVAHLLDHALEPALDAHIQRLEALDDTDAAAAFFDFRVADIAMGSGHFLVAATDRIERKLSQYLAEREGGLPGVRQELARLREAAKKALGAPGEAVEIEDTQLLRRQIARRCIYGVDINPLAVQLARVSLWIHTFVPGLPLSFLDHNLRQGNSLVGIATIDEAREELQQYASGLFAPNAETLLGAAREPLERLAHITDATASEVAEARKAEDEAKAAVKPTAALFDVLTAARLDPDLKAGLKTGATTDVVGNWMKQPHLVPTSPEYASAQKTLKPLPPFHFPIAFPEVFLRGDGEGGFDCILGNPPWEEATLEEDRFWTRHFPGLHSLPEREKQAEVRKFQRQRPDLVLEYEAELGKAEALREALAVGPFPGMGTGDPDVYKAFCWRYMQLARGGQWTGVVLPRSAFCAKGSTDFRQHLLAEGRIGDLTFLLNRGRWVFDDQHPQYTVALLSAASTHIEPAELPMRGPFTSRMSFDAGVTREPVRFLVSEVAGWTDTSALPLLPDEESLEVFAQLRRAPRLDLDDGKSWRARPHRELDATNDKPLMDTRSKQCPEGFWPIYKGESFDIWESDRGSESYYAWVNPKKLLKHLQDKRLRSGGHSKSPFSEFPASALRDPETLPCLHPRIAFRDVTNRTNQRTVIAALVPGEVALTNAAPHLLWARGDDTDRAYLLGILCSIPLDWYARCFVELHVNFHVLNPFPVPRPSRDDPLWQRTVQLAGRLAAPDERFAEWAEKVGVEWGPLPEDEKADMIAELDAVVAHLYGLTGRQLIHVFETFHEGWDYELRLKAVLRHFGKWAR
ncbi:MAG: hypothetical protein FJX75_25480 [Armatimonadetes bacterium]|nr:hypothetical protein [Armatimonadota bacterium]